MASHVKLSVNGVCKSFGHGAHRVEALRDVSFNAYCRMRFAYCWAPPAAASQRF